MTDSLETSASQPGPDDHVLTLSHMLANRIGKAFSSELEKLNITVAEWRVLMTLASLKSASGKEITGRWAMDKMAINRAIASLEKNGLIKKVKNKSDRRALDLSLTGKGQTLYEKFLPIANNRYHKLMAGLDKKEEKRLREILAKLILHADNLAE